MQYHKIFFLLGERFIRTAFKLANPLFGIITILLMMGCAAGISQQSQSKVTYTGPFSALQKTPDAHIGKTVMLGGRIIETKTSPSFSQLTVLQLSLGTGGLPENPDQSEGRFIVQTKTFLDSEVYQKDMLITVVGTVIGSKVGTIGGLKYAYPIIEPIEIKPWPKGMRNRPMIHFGIGVGTSF